MADDSIGQIRICAVKHVQTSFQLGHSTNGCTEHYGQYLDFDVWCFWGLRIDPNHGLGAIPHPILLPLLHVVLSLLLTLKSHNFLPSSLADYVVQLAITLPAFLTFGMRDQSMLLTLVYLLLVLAGCVPYCVVCFCVQASGKLQPKSGNSSQLAVKWEQTEFHLGVLTFGYLGKRDTRVG